MLLHACSPGAGDAETSRWEKMDLEGIYNFPASLDWRAPGSLADPVLENEVDSDWGRHLVSTHIHTYIWHMCAHVCVQELDRGRNLLEVEKFRSASQTSAASGEGLIAASYIAENILW